MKRKMKGKKVILAAIMVVMLLSIFSGCDGIKYGKEYHEFYFHAKSESFVTTGRSIFIDKDNSMSIFYDKNAQECSFEHFKGTDFIQVKYDTTLTDDMVEEYKKYLEAYGDGTYTIEDINKLLEQLSIVDNFHFYKNYLFAESAVCAYRYIDYAQGYSSDYVQIEGVYLVREAEANIKMKLSEGIIYTQDPNYQQDGKYPIQRGTYTIEKDFLVMKFKMDSEIKSEYVVKYLIADIAIPEVQLEQPEEGDDGEYTEEEKWLMDMQEKLLQLKGKKMKCLVNSFSSTSARLK